MKIIRGLAFFSVIAAVFSACFDPPVYPVVPQIEFVKLEYVDDATDSLFLHIDFRDGDGDLGIDAGDPKYRDFPFHPVFYFQESQDTLHKLHTIVQENSGRDVIDIPDPNAGKLVFPRTRKKPQFADDVPAYNYPEICTSYEIIKEILVEEADTNALDEYVIRQPKTVPLGGVEYLVISDTLLFEPNPDHYNIEVDFFVKIGDSYVEYDWRREGCNQIEKTGPTFDARFTVLTDKEGAALEGRLKYGMYSSFKEVFGNKTLRLKIQIKDRARHRSNILTTEDFTLLEILKK